MAKKQEAKKSSSKKAAALKKSLLEPLGIGQKDTAEEEPQAEPEAEPEEEPQVEAEAQEEATPVHEGGYVCLYTVNMPKYSYNAGAILKDLTEEQVTRLTKVGAIEEFKG